MKTALVICFKQFHKDLLTKKTGEFTFYLYNIYLKKEQSGSIAPPIRLRHIGATETKFV